MGGRSWCKEGIRYWQRKEYEVIEELKGKYPVNFLCQVMGVNRSGYYKWRQRQGKMNRYERDRVELTRLLQAAHEKHPSHGYHRLAHSVTSQRGSNKPYYHCLEQLKKRMDKREEQTSQVVFHTDQGAVYSSRAFCQAHHDYNILRSMSRGGTPTDNPIIEALNGWMKEELYLDFDLAHSHDVPALLDAYVDFFNNHRPAAALGYRSPVQFKTERGF